MSALVGFAGFALVSFCFGLGVGLGLRAGIRLFGPN